MTSLALEVDRALQRLDPVASELLDRTVRDAIALADRIAPTEKEAVDAMGYPIGHFATTVGSFANEPLEIAPDLPLVA